jgi:hypothetical protein
MRTHRMAHLVHGCIRRRCPSHPPLQPIEQRGRRFAQGQAVAFGGGDQQHGSSGVVLAQESPAMRLRASPDT